MKTAASYFPPYSRQRYHIQGMAHITGPGNTLQAKALPKGAASKGHCWQASYGVVACICWTPKAWVEFKKHGRKLLLCPKMAGRQFGVGKVQMYIAGQPDVEWTSHSVVFMRERVCRSFWLVRFRGECHALTWCLSRSRSGD